MKKVIFSLAGALLLLSSDFIYAQDPEFTQFYANPLYLNPAFAGSAKCSRLVANYRNQWPGISGTFITNNVSFDRHFDVIKGGIGLIVTQDMAGEGTLNSLSGSAMYSYQLNVTKEFSLRFAGQATYMQKSIDVNKLTFGDMIDPKRGFVYTTAETGIQPKVTYPDFSAGLLGFSKKYFFGVSVHHLTQPNEAFFINSTGSPLPRKYTAHAGAVLPLEGKKGNASFSPNILYQYQGGFQQLNLGFYFSKGPIVGGLWYRGADAAIGLIGIQVDNLKIGYSYDFTVSKLSNSTAGSHEVSLGYVFPCSSKTTQFKTVNCPSF